MTPTGMRFIVPAASISRPMTLYLSRSLFRFWAFFISFSPEPIGP